MMAFMIINIDSLSIVFRCPSFISQQLLHMSSPAKTLGRILIKPQDCFVSFPSKLFKDFNSVQNIGCHGDGKKRGLKFSCQQLLHQFEHISAQEVRD